MDDNGKATRDDIGIMEEKMETTIMDYIRFI